MVSALRSRYGLIVALVIILTSVFPLVTSANSALPVGLKLDPRIAGQAGVQGGNAKYIVFLKDKADLAPAGAMATKAEKGDFVVKQLQAAAQRSQGALVALLKKGEADGSVKAHKELWIDNAIAVEGSAAVAQAIAARPDVDRVVLDEDVRIAQPAPAADLAQIAVVEWNIAKIRANDVWATFGVTGAGTVVGIVDTGADVTHPAIAGKYRGTSDGSHTRNWFDAISGLAVPYDDHGHGTHVAGTVVGDDGGANKIGVAPGAKFISAKAFNSSGSGSSSNILNAMQWMLAPAGNAANAPHIVSNSWGTSSCSDSTFRAAVQAWVAAGIFPVFANGNAGPGVGSVTAPGSYPESFGVGAVDSTDTVAGFSSRGPSCFDGSIKPNVSAPGVGVRSSLPGGAYASWSGTSMATPHVAGLAALIREANPAVFTSGNGLTAVKNIIASTTKDLGPAGPDNDYGTGRIDALAAVATAKGVPIPQPNIVVTPNSFNENVAPGGNVTRQMTIQNTGTSPLNWNAGVTIISGATPQVGAPANPIAHGSRARSGSAKAGGHAPAVQTFQTIINDPLGDDILPPGQTAHVDVTSVEAEQSGNNLGFRVNYSATSDLYEAIGFLHLDTDQNPGTGFSPTNWGGKASQDIGVEFVVDFWDAWFGWVDIYDKNNNWLGSVDATMIGTSFEFIVPLSLLGNDDGAVDVTMAAQHYCDDACTPYPTVDWAPDNGHGSTKTPWISLDIASGSVPAGSSQIVNVTLNAAGMTSGTQASHAGKITIASNDPDAPLVDVPVTMNIGALPPVQLSNVDCMPDVFNPAIGGSTNCSFTLNRTAWAVLIILDNQYNFMWASPFDPVGSQYPAGPHSIPWAGQLSSLVDGPYIPIVYAVDDGGHSAFGFDPLIYVKADNGAPPVVSNMTVAPAVASGNGVAATKYGINFLVDKYHTSLMGVLNNSGAWVKLMNHPEAYAGGEAFLWDHTNSSGVIVPPGTYWFVAAATDLFGRGGGCYMSTTVVATPPSCFSFGPDGVPASLGEAQAVPRSVLEAVKQELGF